jgi:hypothetical protein
LSAVSEGRNEAVTRKSEKIWIVVETEKDGATSMVAYDNETDADNYALEMGVKKDDPERVRVIGTELNRRDEIPFDDTPWGMLRMDIKSEFVEGLMENIVPQNRILPGAAERFVSEKLDAIRQRAASKLDEIVKSETKEELVHSSDEWVMAKGMED